MSPVSTPDRMPPLLTGCEVAEGFQVSERTIRRWAARGILPSVEIGGIRRYRPDDIAALLDGATTIDGPAASESVDKVREGGPHVGD